MQGHGISEILIDADVDHVVGLFRRQADAHFGFIAPILFTERVDGIQVVGVAEPHGQVQVVETGGDGLLVGVQERVFGVGEQGPVQTPKNSRCRHAGIVVEISVDANLRPQCGVFLILRVQPGSVSDRLAQGRVQPGVLVALVAHRGAPAGPGKAAGDAHAGFVESALVRTGVVHVHFDAGVVRPGDDVHHAADGIGTVHGGSAVEQDLDAVHHGERNRGDVRDAAQDAAVAHPAAVHQDQGGFAAETAQVHGRGTGLVADPVKLRAVGRVGAVDVLRQLLQYARQGEFAGSANGLLVEHDQVARQFGRQTGDAATRNDHRLDFGRGFGLGRLRLGSVVLVLLLLLLLRHRDGPAAHCGRKQKRETDLKRRSTDAIGLHGPRYQ